MQVLRRRVALVAVEAVLRDSGPRAAPSRRRARSWRGSRRPRSPSCVASPSTMARLCIGSSGTMFAVDPGTLGRHAERLDRAAHREQRGAQDVERVDLLDARVATAQASARSRIARRDSRRSAARACFESARPLMRRAGRGSPRRRTPARRAGPGRPRRPRRRPRSAIATPARSRNASAAPRRRARRRRGGARVQAREARSIAARAPACRASRFASACGKLGRRRVVLQELRHDALAGEDVGQADVGQVASGASRPVGERRQAVGDHHRVSDERGLERRGAARRRARRRRRRAPRARGRRAASAAGRRARARTPRPRTFARLARDQRHDEAHVGELLREKRARSSTNVSAMYLELASAGCRAAARRSAWLAPAGAAAARRLARRARAGSRRRADGRRRSPGSRPLVERLLERKHHQHAFDRARDLLHAPARARPRPSGLT